MALAIATNNAALRAAASASSVNRDMETSMARLSSGKRINSASDDAAGVAISSRLSAEIRGTDQAVRNSLDGQALIDTAEGAHKEIENILQRMREVAVQAANDTNNDQDRANLQAEMNALMAEIDRISSTTTWAGENLIAADGGTDFSFQVGANTSSENQIKVTLDGMSSKALGLEIDENGSAQATLDVAISSTTTGGGVTTADATIVDGKLSPTAGVNSMTLTLGAGAGTPVEITGLAGDQSTSDAAIIASAINAGTTVSSSGASASTVAGVVTSDPSVTTPITVGPEFQVNTNPTSAYPVSSVTGLTDGGFVVTWSGDNDNNGFNGDVLGQRYDASGSTIGLEFTINTTHGFNYSAHPHPLVTALTDGGFVVTWTGDTDGSTGSILGQRYDANGAAAGSEFQVHSSTYTHQYSPSVTSLDDGGFVVTWTELGAVVGNGYEDILGQRYDANGAAAGSEFQVSNNTAQDHTSS